MSNPQKQTKDFLAPEFLSPSSLGTFRQCPLKFKYQKIDNLPDPSGPEATLGNFVHDVLEELYKLPSELRTQEQAKDLAKELWASKWSEMANKVVHGDKELNRFRWAAWWCVENLWMLEDPKQTHPSGIESFVTGEIGGVKMRGYIDRLHFDESSVTITDYKTGKTPRAANLSDKFLQLVIYSQLLSSLDISKNTESTLVELLYLKDGVRFKHQITTDDIQGATELIQTTKRDLDEACKSGNFEHRKSILCNWCSFKRICPAWGGHAKQDN